MKKYFALLCVIMMSIFFSLQIIPVGDNNGVKYLDIESFPDDSLRIEQ